MGRPFFPLLAQRTSIPTLSMSAKWGKADIHHAGPNVR